MADSVSPPERSVVELTSDLVRIPSVLGSEAEMGRRVAEEMRAMAFDRVVVDEAGSVIGTVDGSRAGPTVLFDAHMDTVGVQPAEAWSRDPFGGEVVEGKLWGRGAADMKGALAAMLCAVGGVARHRLAGRLVVAASVEEERLEGVALQRICERCEPDVVVIGESSGLDLVHAGRGRTELTVETEGRPAHAASPHLGRNAVLRMLEVVRRIEALPRPVDPVVGRGVMCLTDIVSDPFPAESVVPGRCRATYERRLVQGETAESVLEEIRGACERADAGDTWVEIVRAELVTYSGFTFEAPKWLPPWRMNIEHPVVRSSLAALEGVGLAPRLSVYGFCTNAAYSAGVAGIPTVGFGPGSEDQAHIVDEFVAVDQLEGARRGYQALAEVLTGTADAAGS